MIKTRSSLKFIALFLNLALLVFGLFGGLPVFGQQSAPPEITVVNNQPFSVKMPVSIRGVDLAGSNWRTSGGRPVQSADGGVAFVADLPASGRQAIKLENGTPLTRKDLVVKPVENGISLEFAGNDLGKLSWEILYRDSVPAELKGEPYSTKIDFGQNYQPLSMTFEQVSSGPVFDTWKGVGEKDGLQLNLELRVYHDGFLDVRTEFKNIGAAKVKNVYAAVVTRWQQPKTDGRSVCYDNRISSLKQQDATNFRVGESRNWYVQHGVDWLRSDIGKVSAAWMNDFFPEFTVHQEPTAKRPGRWVGANIPQIGYEAQSSDSDLYLLTEIARSNLKSYAERLEDNRLMPVGESVKFESRLAFSQKLTDEQADNAFVAYTTYAEQTGSKNDVTYELGVPYTKFGTNYLPYSTLGENFDLVKLPGMDRDAYWAFAADTVKNWRMFADDIRRDLRIAKSLGFELIRLHHLEMIQGVDKATQYEYLDFYFSELKKLNLRALVDARVSAADTAELVKRYRDQIEGVEVDNEVLIFSVNDDAPAYWKRVYDAVKSVAPEIPVHLTAHTNTGAFDRLTKLGVNFDKIGQHAYSDGLDSQANMRGFSLAAGSYGRRVGKPPIITEWNWRFLTRLSEEDRAKVYAPIFENVLKTRTMPTMYQFQFNETLAMNPRVLKGIRHYEMIWLSRRPKPEAFVLADLINKYSAPNHPNRAVRVDYSTADLNEQGAGQAQFRVTNTSNRDVHLKAIIESPANLQAAFSGNAELRLKPNASVIVKVDLKALPTGDTGKLLPGFYQVFLRLEGDDDFLRYGWAEARLTGEPQFDKETKSAVVYGAGAMDFSLNRQMAVVYGTEAPIQDVETAYAVVNALESAIGRPVKLYTVKDLPKNEENSLILIGTAKTNPLIASSGAKNSAKQFVERVKDGNRDWLVLSGADPVDAERAAMDWTVRFWKYAKDSAARRVGLVEKELPLGTDPTALP